MRLKYKIGAISALAIGLASILTPASAEQASNRKALQGDRLFEYHGCVNCHGVQGKNPVTKKVPQIGGKEADYIVAEAGKILRGERDSDEAKLMHSALAYQAACDAPPTDEELEKIAAWLSKQ
ncbi:MAG: c-type cytochrome [Gammaproteobacteria bacterium]|nr:c-type cytochrome [Gammaproteobacteria bacterium]